MNRACIRGVRGLVAARTVLDPALLSPSSSLHRLTLTELRLAPRHILLGTQRSFFSSKKEEVKVEEAGAELSEAEKALNDRIAELEQSKGELLDKYQRSLADFENLRKRMNK